LKSKRKDGKGHRQPLSPTEPTRIFTIRLVESVYLGLRDMPVETLRKRLARMAKRG